MYRRPIRRATILAITGVLVFAGTAFADQLLADGDVANTGIQGTKPLGNVPAGSLVSVDVEFTLNCVGLGHVDVGQSVILSWSGLGSTPPGGAIVSVTQGSIGPVTVDDRWATDTQGCPSPTPTKVGATRSTVTLRAPTTADVGYLYTIVYDRSLSPAGNNDTGAFSRTATQVSFSMNVVGNAAPTLTVPASHEEEGNTTGGWVADWSGVSATDPEDNPDPTPSCIPAAGTKLLLGLTTPVSCSATDTAGATTTRSFAITVVDRTPPVLTVPPDRSVTTGDPEGVAVTFAPTATDIVDPAPVVDCSPVSGWTFTVGTTPVTCTATDASGNASHATFDVTVEYVAPNSAPSLNVPPSHQEEGNTTGGWVADWSGVSATDAEDDPDPTPTCTPAAGTVLPVGVTTTVSCSVSDTQGATTTGTFAVTVVDTTAPVLAGVPSDRSVTTGDPRGAAVTFTPPTATDIVDASPVVDCTPGSGWRFPVGTRTVTCTATDATGNHSSATFDVNVGYAAPHTAAAIWLEPVAGDNVYEANHGRTIPVKVRLFVDGDERSSGQARLTLTPCGAGDTALELPLFWSGGRWNASLDTSMLPWPCYRVAASIDGLAVGAFRLELRGEASPARSKPSGTSAPTTTIPPKVGPKKPR
jgi:HYR domain